MKKWQRKIFGMFRGWCPKAKEPKTSLFLLARTLKIKDVMRKNIHVAAIFIATTIVTSLILVSLYLSYPVNPPLKQNAYAKTFTDSRRLVSIDIIIHYETELDGTWRIGYFAGKAYNITVLVKPTFINTSTVSMLRILQCHVGAPYELLTAYHELGEYLPVSSTPLDHGIDLDLYWINNATWIAASGKASSARVNLNVLKLDHVPLWYHFVIRLVQANGTREIFTADDTIEIPITSPVR